MRENCTSGSVWGALGNWCSYHDYGQVARMKTTKYYDSLKTRPDRAIIEPKWIQFIINNPEREIVQGDGRLRKWARTAHYP